MSDKTKSIEEKVEEHYKRIFDDMGIRHYGKTECINSSIKKALDAAPSKSGSTGNNYPDIQLYLDRPGRGIPVMIEAKGGKKKLEKLTKTDEIEQVTVYDEDSKEDAKNPHKAGEKNYSSIRNYAVNGALHYGLALLDYPGCADEVIIIGINGSELDADGNVKDPEQKAYYVSKKNSLVPKHIKELDDSLELLKADNADKLYAILDKLSLTDTEIEIIKKKTEATLEERIKKIHQSLYDNARLKTLLSTNEKLYLFCGLIMASLPVSGMSELTVSDFKSNDDLADNDGQTVIRRITSFLQKKHCSADKANMILSLISPVFEKESMWRPNNGTSIIKDLFSEVKEDIIPCLETDLHLDFMGKILNSIDDWVHIENDRENDVILTPRYITSFMARLARTNMDSYVWDRAMGSGGFLVSAMDIMMRDAQNKITDKTELEEKIDHIKTKQIFGVEILGNIYILAVLNMILMGDGSSDMKCGDSHLLSDEENSFPATVFLLNPPYSAPGKGFNFVEETLKVMTQGYACILIQENAGAGQGLPYTKNILKNNTLVASIHMPAKLFTKVGVQTAIYVFKVGRPHEEDDLVKFIDMSEDGYSRQNRKKSTQEVNLRDTDDAAGHYAEVEALVLGKKPKTEYYTKENGLYIEDTITLEGNDWTFAQHKKINTMPTEEDFKKTVSDYLAWKVGCVLKGEGI